MLDEETVRIMFWYEGGAYKIMLHNKNGEILIKDIASGYIPLNILLHNIVKEYKPDMSCLCVFAYSMDRSRMSNDQILANLTNGVHISEEDYEVVLIDDMLPKGLLKYCKENNIPVNENKIYIAMEGACRKNLNWGR